MKPAPDVSNPAARGCQVEKQESRIEDSMISYADGSRKPRTLCCIALLLCLWDSGWDHLQHNLMLLCLVGPPCHWSQHIVYIIKIVSYHHPGWDGARGQGAGCVFFPQVHADPRCPGDFAVQVRLLNGRTACLRVGSHDHAACRCLGERHYGSTAVPLSPKAWNCTLHVEALDCRSPLSCFKQDVFAAGVVWDVEQRDVGTPRLGGP